MKAVSLTIASASFKAPRTLHFTTEGLGWECCGRVASEIWPQGVPEGPSTVHGWIAARRRKNVFFTSKLAQIPHETSLSGEEKTVLIKEWYELVGTDYNTRDFTKFNDKLPAIQGLGARLGKRIGSDYLAGHFEYQLLPSLLWLVSSRYAGTTGSNGSRSIPTAVPSWSWASRPHKITIPPYLYSDSFHVSEYLRCEEITPPKDQAHAPSAVLQIHLRGFLWQIGHTGIDLLQALVEPWPDPRNGNFRALLGLGRLGNIHQRPSTVEKEAEREGWQGLVNALPAQHQILELWLPIDEFDRLKGVPERCHDSNAPNTTSSEEWTDLTGRFMEPTPIFLLFMVLSKFRPQCLGLALEKVGEREGVPVCRRLGIFYSRNLDKFGMPAEELAEQFKSMDQSTVYLC